jgi:hypothetical protein
MQYITLTTALLSSALLTSAAPTTSSTLERRDCQVAYSRNSLNYEVHQDDNRANPRYSPLSFINIPEGAYGCQVEVNFPAGYPITWSGSSTIKLVELVDGKESTFGTVALQSSPVAHTKFVINSADCKSELKYKLQIASDTDAGRVAFVGSQDAGFSLTYNC